MKTSMDVGRNVAARDGRITGVSWNFGPGWMAVALAAKDPDGTTRRISFGSRCVDCTVGLVDRLATALDRRCKLGTVTGEHGLAARFHLHDRTVRTDLEELLRDGSARAAADAGNRSGRCSVCDDAAIDGDETNTCDGRRTE